MSSSNRSSNSSGSRSTTSNNSSRRTLHDYHDHSRISVAEATRLFGSSPGTIRHTTLAANGSQQPGFAVKLHFMLTDVETSGDSSVVSWQPHGRCFVVHNRKAFVERILPSFFLQSTYASFQRQLNLYGFKRIASAPDKGGYYHELFLRSRPELAPFIQRIKRKGNGPRKPDNPDLEPDFYSMPYLPPSFQNVWNGWMQQPQQPGPAPTSCSSFLPQAAGATAAPPMPQLGRPLKQGDIIPMPSLRTLLPSSFFPEGGQGQGQPVTLAAAAAAAGAYSCYLQPQPLTQTSIPEDFASFAAATLSALEPTPIGPAYHNSGMPAPSMTFSNVTSAASAVTSDAGGGVASGGGSMQLQSNSNTTVGVSNTSNEVSDDLADTLVVTTESQQLPGEAEANDFLQRFAAQNALPEASNAWRDAFGESEDFWAGLGE